MFSSFYSYLVLFVFLQYPVAAVDQRFFIGFLHILTRSYETIFKATLFHSRWHPRRFDFSASPTFLRKSPFLSTDLRADLPFSAIEALQHAFAFEIVRDRVVWAHL